MRFMERRSLAAGVFWLSGGCAALAIAFWAEHGLGLVPCELCLLERWPYRILIAIGLIELAATAKVERVRILDGAALLTLLAAACLAFVHFGVEQQWWQSPLPACRAPHFSAGSFAQRLASMPARPAKPCDAPSYILSGLGVSLTTMSLLYAVLLTILGTALTLRLPGTRPRAGEV